MDKPPGLSGAAHAKSAFLRGPLFLADHHAILLWLLVLDVGIQRRQAVPVALHGVRVSWPRCGTCRLLPCRCGIRRQPPRPTKVAFARPSAFRSTAFAPEHLYRARRPSLATRHRRGPPSRAGVRYFGLDGVVLGQENLSFAGVPPRGVSFTCGRADLPRAARGCQQGREMERAPSPVLPGVASPASLSTDASPHQPCDQLRADRQPQPSAPYLQVRGRVVGLLERLEDVMQAARTTSWMPVSATMNGPRRPARVHRCAHDHFPWWPVNFWPRSRPGSLSTCRSRPWAAHQEPGVPATMSQTSLSPFSHSPQCQAACVAPRNRAA